MSDVVNVGAVANDDSGDALRDGFVRINARFQELLGTLTQITWAPGLSVTATPARQWTVVGGLAYVAASNHVAGASFAADLAAGRWLAADAVQIQNDFASPRGSGLVGFDAGQYYAPNTSGAALKAVVAVAEDFEQAASDLQDLADVADAHIEAAYRAGTIATVDFTNSADYQRVISSISNPDTRYDVSVVAGEYRADLRQASVLFYGARLQNITQRGGRIYRVRMAFDAGGTGVTSNSAIVLGFDPGTGTGANVILDNAAKGWSWRQNGNIVATDFNGGGGAGTVDAGIAFTLTSGTVSTFAAGDLLELELQANADNAAGTLRGWKNGLLQFTGTVLSIPAGRLCALARGMGGGGAYPSALRASFSRLASSDPVAAPQVINLGSPTPGQIIARPGFGRAAALSPVRDAQAYTRRAVPSGFEWLPVKPVIVSGAGDVTMDKTLMAALFDWYPALRTGSIAYVSTTGNNGTAQVNNAALPYLTIDRALQSAARIVIVEDGSYAPPDYRFTQAAAGVMKLVAARNAGKVVIKTPGAALSGLTWTLHTGNIWKATIAAAAGLAAWNAFAPHHVRYTDTLDADGFAQRLRYFAPATQDATGVANALTALGSGPGWTYDGRTAEKVLYVSLGGPDVQVNRARIEALYYSSASADRAFASGANIAFDGLYFDGCLIQPIEHNNAGTFIPASVWASNCWMINSYSYAAQPDSNCTLLLDNCRLHASAQDGINGDSTRNGSGAVARFAAVGCYITASGDTEHNGTGVSQNRQAISSHSGYAAGFGCIFSRSFGQEVADTGTGVGPSKSWYVGCGAYDALPAVTVPVAFGFYNDNREAWLDTCVGIAHGSNSLRLEGGASAKIYNNELSPTPVFVSPSVAPTAYTPDAP